MPAIVHGIAYTLPFLFITLNPWALLIIAGTHAVIDRYRLAKHLSWFKNQIGPKKYRPSWEDAKANAGYDPSVPSWMSTWLMIIVDNTAHVLVAIAALAIFA